MSRSRSLSGEPRDSPSGRSDGDEFKDRKAQAPDDEVEGERGGHDRARSPEAEARSPARSDKSGR
eukprot:625713-Prorocentrum_minimum.AAC.2